MTMDWLIIAAIMVNVLWPISLAFGIRARMRLARTQVEWDAKVRAAVAEADSAEARLKGLMR